MASATAGSRVPGGVSRGISGAVSPQKTESAGMLSSKNHSSWSSPMITVTSGFTARSVADSSSSARWQASA